MLFSTFASATYKLKYRFFSLLLILSYTTANYTSVYRFFFNASVIILYFENFFKHQQVSTFSTCFLCRQSPCISLQVTPGC